MALVKIKTMTNKKASEVFENCPALPIENIGWEMWENNFKNAKAFFGSKGNMDTKSKLKDKWFKEFMNNLKNL